MTDSFWDDVREGKSAQPRTDQDELVTEEMVKVATIESLRTNSPFQADNMRVALRAVAPMIAARAQEQGRASLLAAMRSAADQINTAVQFLSDAEERLREAPRGETP